MARSTKFRFDRESELKIDYVINEKTMGSLVYEKNGKITIKNDDFETIVNGVDELEVILKPLDVLMNVMSFKVKRDEQELKLNQKFYGLKHLNIKMSFDSELTGESF